MSPLLTPEEVGATGADAAVADGEADAANDAPLADAKPSDAAQTEVVASADSDSGDSPVTDAATADAPDQAVADATVTDADASADTVSDSGPAPECGAASTCEAKGALPACWHWECLDGKCSIGHDAAGSTCEDGNPCTVGDKCSANACVSGSLTSCDDQAVCTTDSCDAATGECVHVAVPGCGANCQTENDCKDNNICTDAACIDGKCVYPANTAACDDGNGCTVGDMCSSTKCNPGVAKTCNDGDSCTADTCNSKTGLCTHTPIVGCGGNCQSSSDCDDGDPCTDDPCTAGKCSHVPNTAPCNDGDECTTGDTCGEGKCTATGTKSCADTDSCTTDSCDTSTGNCQNIPIVGCGGNCGQDADCSDGNPCTDDLCADQKCAFPANATECTDNNACTEGDKCAGTQCAAGTAKNCDDSNPCTDDACDPATGTCANVDNQAACTDGDGCTVNDVCNKGACTTGTVKICDDGNPCTDDACDKASGACGVTNNTLPCNDNDACTTGDTCGSGACTGGPAQDCDDKLPCTTDSCDKVLGCQHANNTLACDDGNPCTLQDACAGGACAPGAAKVCADGDACTTDSCDPATGNCLFGKINQCGGNCLVSSDCNDQNPCTDDVCSGGKCANNANTVACDDGNKCTTGDACSGGACKSGPPTNCSDGNACTDDTCSSSAGCGHANNTKVCDDGNACTTSDACKSGSCVGGAAPKCDDGNGCTSDSCNTQSGCVYTPNGLPCSDGNACTSNDACSQGKCTAGAPTNCDDGNGCTTDSCSSSSGCYHTSKLNGSQCDSASTVVHFCIAGECVTNAGCSDGSRDALSTTTHPKMAGCRGIFSGTKSLRAAASSPNVFCGDDLSKTCPSPADVCAPGWHICGATGQASEITQLNSTLCDVLLGSYLAAASHCKGYDTATKVCTYASATALNCYSSGMCSEPVCCGSECKTGACSDGVWTDHTHIFSPYGSGYGCAAIQAWADGYFCCK